MFQFVLVVVGLQFIRILSLAVLCQLAISAKLVAKECGKYDCNDTYGGAETDACFGSRG